VSETVTDIALARGADDRRAEVFGAPLAGRLPPSLELPLVSVIVTAYNSERFVRATLESVLAQRYPRFECIVVDDGSTDRTRAVVADFLVEARDARFSLVESARNEGQLCAQIAGFRRATGDFIVFLDSDDLLFSDALESQVAAHLGSPIVVAMTCFDSSIINEHDTVLAGHTREAPLLQFDWFRPSILRRQQNVLGLALETLLVPPAAGNSLAGLRWYWTTQSFMMFRRDAVALVLPERTALFRACADYYLVRMTHAFNSTLVVRKPLGAYRIHGGNHYAAHALISSNQHNADHSRFKWQKTQLTELAAQVIGERFERFAVLYGEFHLTRCLMSIPPSQRPAVQSLLHKRVPPTTAALVQSSALISSLVAQVVTMWRDLGMDSRTGA
jgi:glycosyltransferase involved in cell wall biosynthesis